MATGQTKAKQAEYNRQYRADPSNLPKLRARDAIKRRLQSGKISRQPCEACGAEKTDAHHDDYAKPLEVRWLCRPCHVAAHIPSPKRPRKIPVA